MASAHGIGLHTWFERLFSLSDLRIGKRFPVDFTGRAGTGCAGYDVGRVFVSPHSQISQHNKTDDEKLSADCYPEFTMDDLTGLYAPWFCYVGFYCSFRVCLHPRGVYVVEWIDSGENLSKIYVAGGSGHGAGAKQRG